MHKMILRGGYTVLLVAIMLVSLGLASVQAAFAPTVSSDSFLAQASWISIWYSDSNNFGQIGNPQREINILGRVTDSSITTLKYSLNSDPTQVSLSIGPNANRLVSQGDFNVNIPTTSLNNGQNSVTITGYNTSGQVVGSIVVPFSYTAGRTWPLPYSTNWATAPNINAQAQIVDGLWSLSGSGVTPMDVGYDRVIAIGDKSWSNYEILTSITVRGFVPSQSDPADAGGIGVISNWQGHYQVTANEQPPSGWSIMGAYGYYSNRLGKLALRMNENTVYDQSYPFQLNKTYLIKLRSEVLPNAGTGGVDVGRYSFKIWPQGTAEPAYSDPLFTGVFNKTDVAGDQTQGSALLVAHRADATFGDVTVCPLTGSNYALNITTNGSGTVNQPSQSSLACGQGITITAQANPGWTFTGWSGDITSTSPTMNINMVKAYNLTANFKNNSPVQLGFKIYMPSLFH